MDYTKKDLEDPDYTLVEDVTIPENILREFDEIATARNGLRKMMEDLKNLYNTLSKNEYQTWDRLIEEVGLDTTKFVYNIRFGKLYKRKFKSWEK